MPRMRRMRDVARARTPMRAVTRLLACALVVTVTVACVPFARSMPTSGFPAVASYLGAADRAPARDETVDTTPDVIWQRRIGRGTLGLPAVGERVTVVATVDRWLYALDTRNGQVLWRRRGDSPFGAGPVVGEGLIVSGSEGQYGRVAANRLSDGRRRWFIRIGDVAAPLTLAGGSVYGITSAGLAFAARVSDGRVLWRREIGPGRAAPVILGDRVAYVTMTDTLAVLDAVRGTVVARATLPLSTRAAPTRLDDSTLVLADPAGGLVAIAVPDGRVRWRVETSRPVLGPAVLARDTVFALTTECTLWRVPVAAPTAADSVAIPDCVTEAAPAVLRDGVLVASVRGEVILFDPGTRRRVFTRTVRGALRHPPLVLDGQILVAPTLGEVVSFR
jgi:outer membrane protein assembly factor BamB